MQIFQIPEVQTQRRHSSKLYHEFLRQPTLSMGIYELAAGSIDQQQPHNEDEVYYVVSGEGMIRVGEEDQPVTAGTIVFVEAHMPHRFHSITEDLSLLVFFAPPEST